MIFLFYFSLSFAVVRCISPAKSLPVQASTNEQIKKHGSGFMEDIGFQNFFQDMGVGAETSGSSPKLLKHSASASSIFPSLGGNSFSNPISSPSQLTEEQRSIQKQRGFMPASPFGSASHLSSNIAPPDIFKQGSKDFGSFKFPQAFHNDFGSFHNAFGSGRASQPTEKAAEDEKNESASDRVLVEHRPRKRFRSSHRSPRDAPLTNYYSGNPFLLTSESKKEDQKSKTQCTIVNKDGMDCEVCNDGEGGFSEHCSHSHNSGRDTKYTTNSKTKDNPNADDNHQKNTNKKSSGSKRISSPSTETNVTPSREQKASVLPDTGSRADNRPGGVYSRPAPQIIYVILQNNHEKPTTHEHEVAQATEKRSHATAPPKIIVVKDSDLNKGSSLKTSETTNPTKKSEGGKPIPTALSVEAIGKIVSSLPYILPTQYHVQDSSIREVHLPKGKLPEDTTTKNLNPLDVNGSSSTKVKDKKVQIGFDGPSTVVVYDRDQSVSLNNKQDKKSKPVEVDVQNKKQETSDVPVKEKSQSSDKFDFHAGFER